MRSEGEGDETQGKNGRKLKERKRRGKERTGWEGKGKGKER